MHVRVNNSEFNFGAFWTSGFSYYCFYLMTHNALVSDYNHNYEFSVLYVEQIVGHLSLLKINHLIIVYNNVINLMAH